MENKLCILNSLYKKKPSKKWTWVTPNGQHKNEIDYAMTNNTKVFKDSEVIGNFNFNSDHRMVRATLSGTRVKKAKKFHNNLKSIDFTGDPDILIHNLCTSLNNEMKQLTSIQEKYDNLLEHLRTETQKANKTIKNEIKPELKLLLQERKELITRVDGKKIITNRQKISILSKKINEGLRKHRKLKRTKILERHISKTGGVKKAYKELNSKEDWITNMKRTDGKITAKDLKY